MQLFTMFLQWEASSEPKVAYDFDSGHFWAGRVALPEDCFRRGRTYAEGKRRLEKCDLVMELQGDGGGEQSREQNGVGHFVSLKMNLLWCLMNLNGSSLVSKEAVRKI